MTDVPGDSASLPGGDRLESDVDSFLRHLAVVRNLSPNTVKAYANDLSSFVEWVRRRRLDPYALSHRELRNYLVEQTRAGYTPKTINRRLSGLRTFYRWLVHEGATSRDAAAAIASPKLARTLPHSMSDDEAAALIATCSGDSPEDVRDRAFLELLYASGARISEVAGLTVDDVDFPQAQVRLFGKGSKERIVPIYPAAIDALATYLAQARHALASRGGRGPGRALFVSSRGNAMTADSLRKRFEARVREAGLPTDITPHAMRHTFATEVLSGGADLRSVQELLGHESLSTTQIYTHLSVDRLKEATHQAHPRG